MPPDFFNLSMLVNTYKHLLILISRCLKSIIMNEQKPDISLPNQEEGSEKNIETTQELNSTEEAKELFNQAKKRLLDVNQWQQICGKMSAVFKLADEKGNDIEGDPKAGNYFKIDIPGPGTASGKGYDWVRVEAVEENKNEQEDSESILIRVRPADNPSTGDNNIAHFFSEKATSNFVVSRSKNVVTAAVYGRNEVPNTATDKPLDKTRNAVVGATAIAGFSNPQWKSLANGVLGKS